MGAQSGDDPSGRAFFDTAPSFGIIRDWHFALVEYFEPYTPEWILERTDADIVVGPSCRAWKAE